MFDDLLVSFPPPPKTKYDEPPSPWLKAIMGEEDSADLISTRYEHSSILSKEGVLVVWGGSFQDTKNVKGTNPFVYNMISRKPLSWNSLHHFSFSLLHRCLDDKYSRNRIYHQLANGRK